MPPLVRRHFALPALAATLLLALLPTIGRLGAGAIACGESAGPSTAPHHAMPGMSMRDMAGMTHEQHLAHMAMMAREAMPAPAPEPASTHDGHDCPYCPLLSDLANLAAVPWSPATPLQLAPWSVRAIVHRAIGAPVPALGAQGPPPLALV